VIVPDLLGHGESDKPHRPGDYGTPNFAADVIAVMDAEGVQRAHVWGYSMGASVAEKLAVTFPDRVLSLIHGGFPPGLDANLRAQFLPAEGESLPETLDEAFEGWPPALAEIFKAHNDIGAMRAVLATISASPTTIANLRAAPHPTLAYIGSEDFRLDLAREECAALTWQLVVVPGDHFQAFAQADNVLPLAVQHLTESAGPSREVTIDSANSPVATGPGT
jgi:pimeloyl-ACP methyl ester carboxylesterase